MPTASVDRCVALDAPNVGPGLLDVPEDQWFERKSVRVKPPVLAEALIGMANAEGGCIVIGLSDGQVEGVDGESARVNALMQAGIDFSSPPVRAPYELIPCVRTQGGDDHLLVFRVDPSSVVHANKRDEVFLRVGDETRHLSFHQRQELLYDKGQSSYESVALEGTTFELLDQPLLQNYAAALSHPEPERLLVARGLATRNGQLTIAGCLLFAAEPQALLPEAHIRVLRYRGTDRGAGARQQLVRDVRFEGPLARQIIDARHAVREQQPVRRALLETGVFGDITLIPEDAWLEGIVNAVVHRSYSLAGDHIRVEIFDDRIEVASPGRFPGIVDLSDPLNAVRFARNPRIARVCADQNFGQELGEGIRRMFEEMRAAGLVDPVYRQSSGSVQLTLSTEIADRALEARLPSYSRTIVAALREAGRLSTGDIVELLPMARPATLRRLNELQAEGLIDWVGKSARDPRAYWTIHQTDPIPNDPG